MLLFSLPGLGQAPARGRSFTIPQPAPAGPPSPAPTPVTKANAEEIAARLRQLGPAQGVRAARRGRVRRATQADPGRAVRALAALVGIVAAFAGSYLAFGFIQSVGPDDRSDEFGYGEAATRPPGRRLADRVRQLRAGRDGARARARRRRRAAVTERRAVRGQRDRPARRRSCATSKSTPPAARAPATAATPTRPRWSRSPASTRPRSTASWPRPARRSSASRSRATPASGTSTCAAASRTRTSPTSTAAACGSRASRTPSPVGAGPDSLLRAKNLERVAGRGAQGGHGRARRSTSGPTASRSSSTSGGRTLALDYGYDAQLTVARHPRDHRRAGDTGRSRRRSTRRRSSGWRAHPPRRRFQGPRGRPVRAAPATIRAGWSCSTSPQGSDPPYVVANLRGRGLTWPGRG